MVLCSFACGPKLGSMILIMAVTDLFVINLKWVCWNMQIYSEKDLLFCFAMS